MELRGLGAVAQELERQGGQLWSIALHTPDELRAGRATYPEIPGVLGTVEDVKALEALHLLHRSAFKTMADASNILIDRDGIVRWTYYSARNTDRATPDEVLRAVRGKPQADP